MPLDTSWGTIVGQNIPFFIALLLAIGLLIAARRFMDTHLPAADWPLRFDADAHGRDVSPEEARLMQADRARTLFDRDLLEKIVLIALVTTIFSRNLPGVQATPGQLAIWIAVIVIVNTAVSELLVRRGIDWQSAILEFAAMMAVNVAIVLVAGYLLPFMGGSVTPGSTLFLLLLLTLLVVLYDRFRPYYQVRLLQARQSRPTEIV